MSKFWKMHDGFVQEWEWWNCYPHHPLFEWLLTKAMIRDQKVRGVLVRRGSVLTTWKEMEQAVSNKQHQCSRGSLARALKDLQDSGDLLLKADSQKTMVTICKFENYNGSNNELWTTDGLQTDCKRTAPPINNKNIEYKENNIYSAHESFFTTDDGFVTEDDCRAWMRRYSEVARTFGVADKDLPQQLTATRSQKISRCVRERGKGSVDAMFARLAESPNYFDQGSRGFKGDFTKLWSPSVFDMVLEGSFVPVSKRKQDQPKKICTFEPQQPQQTKKSRKDFLLGWVEDEKNDPTPMGQDLLTSCYNSGELQRLGIDWKPNMK